MSQKIIVAESPYGFFKWFAYPDVAYKAMVDERLIDLVESGFAVGKCNTGELKELGFFKDRRFLKKDVWLSTSLDFAKRIAEICDNYALVNGSALYTAMVDGPFIVSSDGQAEYVIQKNSTLWFDPSDKKMKPGSRIDKEMKR